MWERAVSLRLVGFSGSRRMSLCLMSQLSWGTAVVYRNCPGKVRVAIAAQEPAGTPEDVISQQIQISWRCGLTERQRVIPGSPSWCRWTVTSGEEGEFTDSQKAFRGVIAFLSCPERTPAVKAHVTMPAQISPEALPAVKKHPMRNNTSLKTTPLVGCNTFQKLRSSATKSLF